MDPLGSGTDAEQNAGIAGGAGTNVGSIWHVCVGEIHVGGQPKWGCYCCAYNTAWLAGVIVRVPSAERVGGRAIAVVEVGVEWKITVLWQWK